MVFNIGYNEYALQIIIHQKQYAIHAFLLISLVILCCNLIL